MALPATMKAMADASVLKTSRGDLFILSLRIGWVGLRADPGRRGLRRLQCLYQFGNTLKLPQTAPGPGPESVAAAVHRCNLRQVNCPETVQLR
jgi:hypothetical protein